MSFRSISLPLIAVTALTASGCGSSSTSPSPHTETITGTVAAFGTTRHALNISQGGNMTVTLTWSNGSVDLDLYLTSSSCLNLYPKASCNILVASNSATGTSETVARPVSNGDTYNLHVDNLSQTQAQSYTLNLRIE